mmetsp:Transcript_1720/g.3974  ORF Transcript_1720/g.3974 Transcript_1720/m.3974 type:complete len:83 (+) Transcript_1720:484-732(+)
MKLREQYARLVRQCLLQVQPRLGRSFARPGGVSRMQQGQDLLISKCKHLPQLHGLSPYFSCQSLDSGGLEEIRETLYLLVSV